MVRVKTLIQDIKDIEKQLDGIDGDELLVLYDDLKGCGRMVLTITKGILRP